VIPGFIGPAYESISRSLNAQRCINLRLEIDPANGKTPLALVGLPGYRRVIDTLPAAPVRGFWRAASRVFVVVGTDLYELHDDMTTTLRGSLSLGSGLVSMADNGLHLMVVDGVGVLALELETNVATNTIANFPYGARFIVCIDSTFIAEQPDSQRFQVSAVGDALTWSAIDFASAEALPDNIVALIGFNRQLYILGAETFQVFWNSGDGTRPFVPVEGAIAEIGCAAPYSAAKEESGVYWLGLDKRGGPRIYKAQGANVAAISTPPLDIALRGYTLTDASGYTFRADGHIYYVLTFPTDDTTWLYDASTQAWHEFKEWSDTWHRHRSNCAIYAHGRQLIGDFENGRIYELSAEVYANDGQPLRALRASAHVSDDQRVMIPGSIEVITEPGVGLNTGQGEDPQMMLRVSKDGGFTWGNEMSRTMGRQGMYRNRVRFNRPCGAARDLVFEVSITDPVKRVIVGAVINGV
jgi:hypothetical protein